MAINGHMVRAMTVEHKLYKGNSEGFRSNHAFFPLDDDHNNGDDDDDVDDNENVDGAFPPTYCGLAKPRGSGGPAPPQHAKNLCL